MSVDSLLKYARAQVGYVETPTNRNKYGRQFGQDGVFWCMQFVWACYENSDNRGLVPKTASTRDLFHRAKNGALGMQWLDRNATPLPGDIVEFDMGGPKPVNHVGIVEAVSGGKIICIEGNTGGRGPDGERNGGMVARKRRDRTNIVNFVRPRFPAGQPTGGQPRPPAFPGRVIKLNDKGDAVKQIQARLNAVYKGKIAVNGNKPLRADGEFGSKTEATVRDFQKKQGLEVDGKVGRNTWTKLFG